MTIAEVHVTHPDLVLAPTIRAATDVQLEREFQPVPVSDKSVSVLFFSLSGDFMEFEQTITDDPTVTNLNTVVDYGDRRVYRVQVTDQAKLVTPKLAELGIQLLDVRSRGDGWLLRVVLPSRDALSKYGAFCDAKGIAFSVKAMYEKKDADTRGEFGLTDSQREALLTARERGFFDDPRGISLQDLADEVDVSPSAMGCRIRRAAAKLIDATLDTDE